MQFSPELRDRVADGTITVSYRLWSKRSNGCLIGMIVEAGRWRRLTPAHSFLC